MASLVRSGTLLSVAFAAERTLLSRRAYGTLNCEDDFYQLAAGDFCVSTWSTLTQGTHQLRATEPWIGRANVARQLDSHFSSKKHAEKWFGKHTIPAVIGDQHLYLTDNHHHCFAINLNSDTHDLEITIQLVDDFRGLGDDFWPQMRENHYSLLWLGNATDPFAMPQEVGPDVMPEDWDLSHYPDSIWRSLAAFGSDFSDPVESRCYVKTCDYFLDYQWGYVMQVATTQDQSLWPTNSAANGLLERLQGLPLNPDPTDVDLDVWRSLAADLLPLCHSEAIRDYPLPSVFEMPSLQGWSAEPLPDDPVCTARSAVI